MSPKVSLLALAVSSALLLSACSDDDDNVKVTPPDPDPVVELPDAPPALSFVGSINIIDSNSNASVNGAKVTLLENGSASSNVTDLNGTAISGTVDTSNGLLGFSIKNDIQSLTAIVEADNYLTKSFELDLSGENTAPVFKLSLVSLTSDSIANESKSAAASGGQLSEALTVSADKGAAGAGVTVPTTVVLQDAAGNAISGSNISLAVTSGSNAAEIVPEGLNGNASTSATVEVPVGATSIVMTDENGNKIKKFSSPIEVTVNIPEGTQIPALGRAVQEGDELNVASHNEDTGVWTNETFKATVGALSNGSFPAKFMTDHLTTYVTSSSKTKCTNAVVANISAANPDGSLTVKLSSPSGSKTFPIAQGQTAATLFAANSATFGDDAKATVEILDNNNNSWGSDQNVDVCGSFTVNVNPPPTVSESVTVTRTCSNNPALSGPASGVRIQYGSQIATLDANGTATLSGLTNGSTVTVSIESDLIAGVEGSRGSGNITADGTAETIDIQLECPVVTGG